MMIRSAVVETGCPACFRKAIDKQQRSNNQQQKQHGIGISGAKLVVNLEAAAVYLFRVCPNQHNNNKLLSVEKFTKYSRQHH